MSDTPRTETVPPGEPVPTVRLFAPGTEIGRRYEVRRVLGSGGSAVVYAAWDRELKRDIALKVLRHDRMTGPMLKRFRREVGAARDADSPRLVKVYDIGTSAEAVFLTMELVDGESLRELLLRGPLPVDEAVRIGIEVAEGLAALHRIGLVHRDVKPGNVLLAASGIVKLADFGLVRRWDADESRATETDAVAGTFEYLSPEQALGRDLDGRSDLYGLGILLFEMLTGDVPHRGLSSIGTVIAHIREKTPGPREKRPEVPAWLSSVVLRLLEKDPADRYATAGDVLTDLRAHRAPARRPPPAKILWRGSIAALVVLGVAALLPVWPWNKPRLARLEVISGQAALAYDGAGNVLWRRDDLTDPQHATAGRFDRSTRLGIAAILDRKGPADPAGSRALSFLDGVTGREVGSMALPSPAPYFPGFSDTFAVGQVRAVDLAGDGRDQVVVTFVHSPWWPSLTVLCDPSTRTAEVVFVGSGHHRLAFAADLDGDGRKELVLAGTSNRFGWNVGIAAVRPPVQPGGGARAAGTPDRPLAGSAPSLLWYALVPSQRWNDVERTVRWDEEKHVITLTGPSGRVEMLDTGGFLRTDVSSLPPAERAEARRRAYDRLREAVRLLDAGFLGEALAEAEQAVAAASRASDGSLTEWTGRVKVRVLVRLGRAADADAAWGAMLPASPNRAEIAFEAGNAFHLSGELGRAVAWYRRGIGRGGEAGFGRAKRETLDGLVFALGELGRWDEALAEVDRFTAIYPEIAGQSALYRALVLSRAGRPFAAPGPPAPGSPDLDLAWGIELRAARGGEPEALLAEIERALASVSGEPYILLATKADVLERQGRDSEALETWRKAWASALKARAADVVARLYARDIGTRLARFEDLAHRPAAARAVRAELRRI
jgi:tRNA A-37 threonylcarbamoyl transferase component Bud32/tetratricopeptide (TPR) repeat protein